RQCQRRRTRGATQRGSLRLPPHERPSSGGRSRRQPSAQYTTTLLMLLPARRRAALVSLVVSAHPRVGMTNLRGQLIGTFLLLELSFSSCDRLGTAKQR